jgi:hypothetical protein
MPAKPSWLLNIPDIIRRLSELETPVVDRQVCERLFGVRRRRALVLMEMFGGYRSANAILIDRLSLIESLKARLAVPDVQWERSRKMRLAEKLTDTHCPTRSANIQLQVPVRSRRMSYSNLPHGITLSRGTLTVVFTTPIDLFSKLYELSQAAVDDFDAICDAASSELSPTVEDGAN